MLYNSIIPHERLAFLAHSLNRVLPTLFKQGLRKDGVEGNLEFSTRCFPLYNLRPTLGVTASTLVREKLQNIDQKYSMNGGNS